jgi:hypothetical protein
MTLKVSIEILSGHKWTAKWWTQAEVPGAE